MPDETLPMKTRPTPKMLPLAALLLPLAVMAQAALPITIADPAGDDDGDGTLSLPRDSAFAPGDLDLRSLRIAAEGDGLRVEATFANPVRHPSTARGPGLGSEDLGVFARRGFYAFNLDLYLDLDRVPGAGMTATLPGRGARIDAAHAWDKAVVLTPRPELMRRQLREALAATGVIAEAALDAELDRRVFFATDVRVRGRSVSFAVPGRFVTPTQAGAASVVGLVTAAKLAVEAELGAAFGRGAAVPTLGALQPAPGQPQDGVGYRGDKAPATAVVDLLAPNAAQQKAQLAGGAALTGLTPDNGTSVGRPPGGGVSTPSALPFALALEAVLRGAPVAAAPVPAPAPVPAAAPAPVASPPPAPAVAAPAPVPSPARPAAASSDIEERLATLKRLRERNLITEDEYQQKRRELLDRL